MAALKLQKIKYRTATNTNTWNSFLDMCYPVGSIVHFINNTSPNTYFGGGTWSQLTSPLYISSTQTAAITRNSSAHNPSTPTNTVLTGDQSPNVAYSSSYYLSDTQVYQSGGTNIEDSNVDVQSYMGDQLKHNHLYHAAPTYSSYKWAMRFANLSETTRAIRRGTINSSSTYIAMGSNATGTAYQNFVAWGATDDTNSHNHTMTIPKTDAKSAHAPGITASPSLIFDWTKYPRTPIYTWQRTG